jgi:hypothetical protein
VTDDFPDVPPAKADLDVFAVFRCSCGQLAAMANQVSNGNAAMVHGTPWCERFTALRSHKEAIAYFRSLESVPMTEEVKRELERNDGRP